MAMTTMLIRTSCCGTPAAIRLRVLYCAAESWFRFLRHHRRIALSNPYSSSSPLLSAMIQSLVVAPFSDSDLEFENHEEIEEEEHKDDDVHYSLAWLLCPSLTLLSFTSSVYARSSVSFSFDQVSGIGSLVIVPPSTPRRHRHRIS